MAHRPWPWALAILVFAGATVSAWGIPRWVGPPVGSVCRGLRLSGHPVPSGAAYGDFVREVVRENLARPVRVVIDDAPGLELESNYEALGVRIDAPRTLQLLEAIGRQGNLAERWVAIRRARAGELDVPLAVSLDATAAMQALLPFKELADEPPVNARLDVASGRVTPGAAGRFLALDSVLEALLRGAKAGASEVHVTRVQIPPRVAAETLAGVQVGELLARYQTGFSRRGDQASRARNIETGTARLNGVVLLPHELFSFNAEVGPRTLENGFSKGWQIFKGEMVEGIGGGTCQVASTFHAAAMLGGLDVVERLPHSRPSAYIPLGLDATVVYPVVDLKLRNPFDFPVVVRAYVEGNVVAFELYGRSKAARVVFDRTVVSTRPFERRFEERPGLPADRIIRKQHGIRGYKIARTRRILFRDGKERVETSLDVYPPTFEQYWVPAGAGPELLAALPAEDEESAPPDPAPDAGQKGPQTASIPWKIVDSPGAHPPTRAQRDAPVRLSITQSGAGFRR